jgi:hypothetical protein
MLFIGKRYYTYYYSMPTRHNYVMRVNRDKYYVMHDRITLCDVIIERMIIIVLMCTYKNGCLPVVVCVLGAYF